MIVTGPTASWSRRRPAAPSSSILGHRVAAVLGADEHAAGRPPGRRRTAGRGPRRSPALPLSGRPALLADLRTAAAGARPRSPPPRCMVLGARRHPQACSPRWPRPPATRAHPRPRRDRRGAETAAARPGVRPDGRLLPAGRPARAGAACRQRAAYRRDVARRCASSGSLAEPRRAGRRELVVAGARARSWPLRSAGRRRSGCCSGNLSLVAVPAHAVPLVLGVAVLPSGPRWPPPPSSSSSAGAAGARVPSRPGQRSSGRPPRKPALTAPE